MAIEVNQGRAISHGGCMALPCPGTPGGGGGQVPALMPAVWFPRTSTRAQLQQQPPPPPITNVRVTSCSQCTEVLPPVVRKDGLCYAFCERADWFVGCVATLCFVLHSAIKILTNNNSWFMFASCSFQLSIWRNTDYRKTTTIDSGTTVQGYFMAFYYVYSPPFFHHPGRFRAEWRFEPWYSPAPSWTVFLPLHAC